MCVCVCVFMIMRACVSYLHACVFVLHTYVSYYMRMHVRACIIVRLFIVCFVLIKCTRARVCALGGGSQCVLVFSLSYLHAVCVLVFAYSFVNVALC